MVRNEFKKTRMKVLFLKFLTFPESRLLFETQLKLKLLKLIHRVMENIIDFKTDMGSKVLLVNNNMYL